jgi:hypothetical protein
MLRNTVCASCWPPASIPDLAKTLIELAARYPVGAIVARGPRGGVHQLVRGRSSDELDD